MHSVKNRGFATFAGLMWGAAGVSRDIYYNFMCYEYWKTRESQSGRPSSSDVIDNHYPFFYRMNLSARSSQVRSQIARCVI